MAQDNIIKVKFQSDGDKGLIKAIEKLDAVHKKLTKAQENLIDVGKKGGRANVNAINTLRRYNARLKENNLTLKDLNISSFTYSTAIRGNKLALEQVRLATEKHTKSLKRQTRGMFETEHSTRILGGSFAVLRSKLLLASFAGTLVASTIGRLARQFGVQEDAERNLSTQLGHVNKNLLEQASALQSITTHGDESLLQVMRFASTLGIQESELVKVTKASIGLSEAYGLDLRQSTRMLALATSGNTEMLNRYIPELRNAKGESEKLAIVSKKVTEGFELHIKKTGTLNFTLDQMGNSVGDVAEKIGQVLAPAVIFTAKRMQEFADTMDEGKVKRFQAILSVVTLGFVAYRTAVIASAIATNGFAKSLTRTGIGVFVVMAGLAVEQLMSMAGMFEENEESLDGFNEKQKTANKLTKEQLDNIDKIKKALAGRKKSIDDEIHSLLLRQAELTGATDLEKLEIQLGFEFVNSNGKRIKSLIELRKKIKELEQANKDKAEQEKFERNQRQKIAEDLKAVEESIIQDKEDVNKKKNAEQKKQDDFERNQAIKLSEDLKAIKDEIVKDDLQRQQNAFEAKQTVFEQDLGFQMLQVELEAERYRQLLQSSSDRMAIDDFELERKREIAQQHLEAESTLFNASMGAYDAFVQSIMDADTNMLQTREAVLNAFKESAIKFVAEMIKEKIKQTIADAVIRGTAEKTAVASAKMTSKQILMAYAPSAVATSTATFGASAVAGQVAMGASYASLMGLAKFESGGLIGGQPHSQGGTVIEAERGEFVMSKNAVDSIGLEALSQMNETGSQPITVNINGHVLGTREFVRGFLIPEITSTIKKGLA